jgi:hypothetical protein
MCRRRRNESIVPLTAITITDSLPRLLQRLFVRRTNGLPLLALMLLFGAGQLSAAFNQTISVRSRSGQFTVQGLASTKPFFNLAPTGGVSYVRVDPTVLAVSSENIKQALLSTLQLTDRWQGRVTMHLRPVIRDDEEIIIESVRYTDGWQYRVNIPEQVNKSRLMRAVVEVLLLEIAQRSAGERRLELPPWLVPGLTAHLGATEQTPLIVEPESRTNRKRGQHDALKEVRGRLRVSGGLSLDQLNWPDQRTDLAAYEASAHLFVHELLRSSGGFLLSDLLARLRDHLNWQTAFLKTYKFRSLRDADKWWTLNLVQFAGRESLVTWTVAEVGAHLGDILVTPVQVRLAPSELPITTDVMLHQMLQEWEWTRQSPVLQQKLIRLEALRYRAVPPLRDVLDGYRQTLAEYVARRERLRGKPAGSTAVKSLVNETVQRLNDLDVRREVAMGGPSGAAAAALSTSRK